METRTPSPALLGVDVCKAFLDACLLHPCGRAEERRFANSPEGIAALLAWGGGASVVGMESTGGYERDLALAGTEAGLLVRVENPRRVRDFARATGRLNKTDRADARAVAGFLGKVEGRPWRLAAPVSRELEGLTAHRGALVEERTRLANAWSAAPRCPRSPSATWRRAGAPSTTSCARRTPSAAGSPAPTRGSRATSRPSRACPASGRRPPSWSSPAPATSRTTPAPRPTPRPQGSPPAAGSPGSWKGRTRISKQGDASLRSGIYMAAVVASRFDPVLKEFRERLLAGGKTKMQALVACMRKLLMRCYGVLKAVRAGKEPFYGERPRPESTGGA